MKKHEILFSIVKIPIDFLIIFFSFYISRDIRNFTDLIPWVSLPTQTINNQDLFYFALFWGTLFILLLSIHNLYKIKITSSKIKEVLNIIRYSIYWFIFFSAIIYLSKYFIYEKEIPRLIILFTLIIWTSLIICSRIILNSIQNYLLNKNIISKRNILIITNKNKWLLEEISKDIKSTNVYNIIWYINTKEIKSIWLQYLWNSNDIKNIIIKNKIDEIIFINTSFDKNEIFKIWDYSRILWVRYRTIINSFDITQNNSEVWLINKIPVIEIKNTSLDSWWRVIKRIIDIIWSSIGIIVFSPIMIITAILIKIDDPKAPIIYKNRRVWQNWKDFNLFKFRYLEWKYCIKDSYWTSNKIDEALKYEEKLIKEKSTREWPLYKIQNDPRKTKIWNYIEKYSIDELPQFFNVLRWDMSLVWPRPHQPREVEKYEDYHLRVLTIKPWISWMAQVNWRENNTFDDEVKLDIFYIENRSILLDFKIILKTFTTIIKR